MIKNNKKAFTLSETLIVLTVLGIISALVIPQLMIRYQESMNRVKIKKAMTVYDGAIAKMTVENDLKTATALKKWANQDTPNCDNPIEYFKTTDRDACTFRTSDGVWWDITNIMEPIIAVSQKALNTAKTEGTDGKNSFKFVTSYDVNLGTFRVNDLKFEKDRLKSELANADEESQPEIQKKIEELEKLFGMVGLIDPSSTEQLSEFMKNCQIQTTEEGQPKQCKIGNTTFTEQEFSEGSYNLNIGRCYIDTMHTTGYCAEFAKNSKAESGTFFTANIGGNKTWDEAKTECEKMNAEVATAAQLQQLYIAGKLKVSCYPSYCGYWAKEDSPRNSTQAVSFTPDNGGTVDSVSKDLSNSYLRVLCVANK